MKRLLAAGLLLALGLSLAVTLWPSAPETSARALADGGLVVEAPKPIERGHPASPAPSPRRVVHGLFVDEEGNPVADAGITAFAHGSAWAQQQGFQGCDAGLFTCGSVEAAREVLAQARAGTLRFPEPIASTRTDADGGFTLEGPLDDALLMASLGSTQLFLGVDELPEPLFRLYELDPGAQQSVLKDDAPAPGVEVTLINPFTREVQQGRTDAQGNLAVKVGRPWYWAAAEAPGCNVAVKLPANNAALELAPPRTLRVHLRSTQGPVEGEVSAFCQGADYRLRTRDAGLVITDIPRAPCAVTGDADGLSAPLRTVTFDELGRAEVTLTLLPTASLTITVLDALTGGPVGEGAVLMRDPDTARPPRALRIMAGERGLLRGTEPRTLLLETSFEGYLPETRDVVLPPGVTDLEFALRPAQRIVGAVVDATGTPVQYAEVRARFAGAGPAPRVTDADGGFSFQLDAPGPWQLSAVSPSHGRAQAEVTAPGRARLVLAAKNTLLVHVAGLPNHESAIVALSRVDGAPLSMHGNGLSAFRGPARAVDLPPGEYRLVIRRDGFMPAERRVTVPAEGTVSLTVQLERGHAVSGVVLDEKGRPVENAYLGLEAADAGAPADLFKATMSSTDARGRFSFEHLPALPVTVTAQTQTASAEAEVTPPAKGVTLRLVPGPRWTGRAVDAAGRALTRFIANHVPVNHPEGRFDVTGAMLDLEAGELTAYATGTPREVGDVVLRGRRSVKVSVLLPSGAPAARARVRFPGVGHYYRSTDGDGRVAYEFVDEGRETRLHMDVVHAEGYALFEGTSAQETTVTLSPWLRVEGRVENERGEGVADAVAVSGLELSHETRLTAGADGHFVARVAPGTWAFSTANSGAGLIVKIDREGQRVVLKPGTGACELRLSGDRDEPLATLTLARPGDEAPVRLPYLPGAEVPLRCGPWRARLASADGGVRLGELDLQPSRARLTTDPDACEHADGPCFVLRPAME